MSESAFVLLVEAVVAFIIWIRISKKGSAIHGKVIDASLKLDEKYGWKKSSFMFENTAVYQYCKKYVENNIGLFGESEVGGMLSREIEKRFSDLLR